MKVYKTTVSLFINNIKYSPCFFPVIHRFLDGGSIFFNVIFHSLHFHLALDDSIFNYVFEYCSNFKKLKN